DIDAIVALYGTVGILPRQFSPPPRFGFTDPPDLTALGDPDTDGDGVPDSIELLILNSDSLQSDTDNDALSDYVEVFVYGTNSLLADTDGDGVSDGDEVAAGSDPLDADDPTPQEPPAPTMVDVVLAGEWTAIVYPGGESIAAADLADQIPGLLSMWAWSAGDQAWLSFRPGLSNAQLLNTLTTIDPGQALFIRREGGAPATISLPDELSGPTTHTLVQGWTFIGYAGGTALVVDVFAGAAPPVAAGFRFDGGSQQWNGHHFGVVDAVNAGFLELQRLTAVFVFNPGSAQTITVP
ncbi:MAG: hypothetical protein O7A71_00885, partial [Chloroflexi bacterium]|nr:hypothetical protein [Chloroflexota bacterium]